MSKKKSFSIINLIFLILNIIAIAGLLSAYLANYLNPKTYFFAALSGLFYPYILAINLLFIIFWLFKKWQYCFFSLITLFIGMNSFQRFYQFTGKDIPSGNDSLVKILSYNVQTLGIYNDNNNKEKILDFLKKEKPDIVCFQEYCQNSNPENKVTAALQIKNAINANNQYLYLPLSRENYQFGMAIFSRFPIINKESITFEDAKTNHAMFADIVINGDTIRVYNIHFQSIHFGAEDYLFARQAASNTDISNEEWKKNGMRILRKIKSGFAKRKSQVDTMVKHIENSPYKVIVCGDFNDTPWSYTYKQIRNLLDDSFVRSGKGIQNTMKIRKLLSFRIDYIFHDRFFKSYGFTTEKINASDHYPIYTYIDVK
jgi:endonuclease/exonuclease/phosphatase family metal-dependent hydrolase